MRHVAVVAALAVTILAGQASAQITTWSNPRNPDPRVREGHLTVFGAFALPTGNFGSTSASSGSFAGSGAGLGLEFSALYAHDIESGGIVLVDRNPTDVAALEASLGAALQQNGISPDPLVISAGSWQLAWGLLKVGYAPRVGRHLQACVDAYGGALFSLYPEMKLVEGPPGLSIRRAHESWLGPAAGVGVGLRWHEHVKVGLLYLSGAAGSKWRGSAFSISRQQVQSLHATLGYAFGY